MSKTNTTSEDVKVSVSSIYADLLEKRKREKEEKEEAKRKAKEEKENTDLDDDNKILSKKERRQKELDNWKTVVIGLTGDDLEYSDSKKKKKKKYTKWIDDDMSTNGSLKSDKPKKSKPKNYNKEFAKELDMLRALAVDQNKFTNDLQKRFQTMVGPNTRDASPLNKTEVELAGIVNNARSNSLGFLKEIGNIKKTIADLYMRQKKLNADLGGLSSNADSTDLGLMGSSIASALYGDTAQPSSMPMGEGQVPTSPMTSMPMQQAPQQSYAGDVLLSQGQTITQNTPGIKIETFDPQTWDGGGINVDPQVQYEAIPHDVVVEWNKGTDEARFKAVRKDNGEELIGCPVPSVDPSKLTFNEKDLTVRGQFDESYKLEILGGGE